MKKIFIYILFFMAAATISCRKELNIDPLGEVSETAVWTDASLMEAFVNDVYSYTGTGIPNELMLMSLSDEGFFTHGWTTAVITEGNLAPENLGSFGGNTQFGQYHWDNNFKGIRNCNMFLENVRTSPVTETDRLERLTGEIKFLRAFLYHNLVRSYGAVPIINKTFGLQDDFLVPRNSFKECIDFIVSDCDSAAMLLPDVSGEKNIGRATKGAALALKARVLLYAASDLYHNTNEFSGFSNPELIGYPSADRAAMWRAAKDAAKVVMDLNIYNLYKNAPAAGDSIEKNLADIFLSKNNEEIIFAKYYIAQSGPPAGRNYAPNGFLGWGSNVPSQELVDDFEMKDGSRFDWNDPEHASRPYANRDPRLYASIMYDGSVFQPRPSVTSGIDPVGIVETAESIEFWNAETSSAQTRAGLDSRQGPVYNWNGTYTGYYIRKYLDDKVIISVQNQDVPWVYMRYAEVLLNYAEASIELNEFDDARTAMNLIRARAGMPDAPVSETGPALKERYRNERRIELAFEEHRFFDARRWMIADKVFGRNLTGIKIVKTLNPDHITHTVNYTPHINVQNRAWQKRNYFLPIPAAEILKNDILVQNPEY